MNILMMTNTFTLHVVGPSSKAIRQIFFSEKMAGAAADAALSVHEPGGKT
jgi:hypothetical protein